MANEIVIDNDHSTVGFNIPIAGGVSKVTGKFTKFNVDLNWNAVNPLASKVSASIEVDSIDTGIPARDDHLKTPDFFDVENYPQIIFKSSSITGKDRGYIITGTLSFHGVSKELTFPLHLDEYTSPEDNRIWKSFSLSGELNRRDFGITWEQGDISYFVGDVIGIEMVFLAQ